MARRVFFSFHYQNDVSRAWIVRNSWVTQEREDAGFYDSSAFERFQRTGDDALKQFLNRELDNSSVTCVLAGAHTAWRRWVRYEIFRSVVRGNGLFGVKIHSIPNLQKQVDNQGDNPFSLLGFELINGYVRFKEHNGQQWVWSPDFPRGIAQSDIKTDLKGGTNSTLDSYFGLVDWNSDSGYQNLGSWVEIVAKKAGR